MKIPARTPRKIRYVAALITFAVAFGMFAVSGTAHAAPDDEGDMPGPVIDTSHNPPHGSTPNCVAVKWQPPAAIGEDIDGYRVIRTTPPYSKDVAENLSDFVCGQEPDTSAEFKVCAVYISEAEDEVTGCSSANLRTTKAIEPAPSQRPPAPRVDPVKSNAGPTFIGVHWDAYYNYDFYFINYWLQPSPPGKPPVTIRHADDGTWGYQRIDGLLPSRTYTMQVQGCRDVWFGIDDQCFDWGPIVEMKTHDYPLHSGPDTCAPPFVWREAFAGDKVCVDGKRRDQVKADNAKAEERRAGGWCNPGPGPINCSLTSSDNCKRPWVWREARPNDKVCVTWQERDLIRSENATAADRRARPR